jgi:two-component system KDP operon response regulator KdpE
LLPKIIIIDKERQSRKLLCRILKETYEVIEASSFAEGSSLINSHYPDMIIIDPLSPKTEGISLISSVREWSDCPIIALSANATESAAVSAISAGADDYIRKPFFTEELLVRIKSNFRRISAIAASKGISFSDKYKCEDLTVEFDTHSVFIENQRVHLTRNEFKILSLLCRHAGKVLTYDFILKNVWGPKTDNDTGILRVNITNLRKKIEKDYKNPKYIFTENSIGYRMAENLYSPAE